MDCIVIETLFASHYNSSNILGTIILSEAAIRMHHEIHACT